MLLQEPGEGLTGELAALVVVEYLGFALPERLFQSLDAEAGRVLESLHLGANNQQVEGGQDPYQPRYPYL